MRFSQAGNLIWEGVYDSFDAVPRSHNSGHAHATWLQKSLGRLQRVRDEDCRNPLREFSANPLLILAPILSVLSEKSRVTVTEVGGNLGQLFHFVERWIDSSRVSWRIVEAQELLEHPAASLKMSDRIEFQNSLSLISGTTDILYFGSSLQYIEDLSQEVIPFLNSHSPEWLVVGDGMAGENIPTFVTWQNYYGEGFPSKFRNIVELTSAFEAAGYTCVLESPGLTANNYRYYPSQGLKSEFQIPFPLDLIFRRSG